MSIKCNLLPRSLNYNLIHFVHIFEIIVTRLKYKDIDKSQVFAFQIAKAFLLDWQALRIYSYFSIKMLSFPKIEGFYDPTSTSYCSNHFI